MKRPQRTSNNQRGVAVIMALLLTTLAITIVASLFWQQQVQVRLIENQRLQLQKQWILRGALDWASLILREDAKYSSVDTLDEPWAAPLAETRLDQYVENGKAEGDIADTTLSGGIEDAQARFNLNNLARNGLINPQAVSAFAKLLTLLKMDPEIATTVAKLVANATPVNGQTPQTSNPGSTTQAVVSSSMHSTSSSATQQSPPYIPIVSNPAVATSHAIAYTQIDDLFNVSGMTPQQVTTLKPYVIFLPSRTTINVNTASSYVIAALIPGLTLTQAESLISSRTSASFRDVADFSNRLRSQNYIPTDLSVTSSYFLIEGKVHMNRARLNMQALLERNGVKTRTLWIREF